jgi:cytochrome c peroxidase
MRKLIVFSGVLLAIILVVFVIYNLFNIIPLSGNSENEQVLAIFDDASCVLCHQDNSVKAYKLSNPVVRAIINGDVEKGLRKFDIDDLVDKLDKNIIVNEVDLAKIEYAVVINNTMPPKKYAYLYWGASISSLKHKILKKWVETQRDLYYLNSYASEFFKHEPVRPLPSFVIADDERVALGEKLFRDKRLSSDNSVSCFSCHNLTLGGMDNRQYSEGVDNTLLSVNTPSVYNSYFNFRQFWDGRVSDPDSVIIDHLLDPDVMANESVGSVTRMLRKDKEIKALFDSLYNDGLTQKSFVDALSSYVKSLVTPDSRFDKYLKGDFSSVTGREIKGYELFKANKCATCHVGILLGGQSMEQTGLYGDYFSDRGWAVIESDSGRFNQTGDVSDRYRFKVPGLRNVAVTRPYFHDGSRYTLFDAVRSMSKYQTNRKITDEETAAIVEFLNTLTGEP